MQEVDSKNSTSCICHFYLISILQFAAFIPGYVHTLHEFLFPSSEETNDTEINEHQQ